MLLHLIHFNENLEYILKHSLHLSMDGSDLHEKYGGIITLKIICEHKKDFLIDKKQYCIKIIECLVHGNSSNSKLIQSESYSTLVNFLEKLTIFPEISKSLSPKILKQIHLIQKETHLILETQIDSLIKQSVKILSNPLIKADKVETDNRFDSVNISQHYENKMVNYNEDISGNAFGIFPNKLIQDILNDNMFSSQNEVIDINTYQEKNTRFQNLYNIFNEKHKETQFIKNANTFFTFLTSFINSNSSSIVYQSLMMINTIIKITPSNYLLTNFYTSIGQIINTFKYDKVYIRKTAFDIITKILMLIPTSQIIPYVITSLANYHDNWTMLCDCLNLMMYIFSNLTTIYNDIEWNGNEKNYDVNLFLEIMKLFDHTTPKVVSDARKIIKYFAEVISENKENFLKELSFYVNESLYKELYKLIIDNQIGFDRTHKPKVKYDVAMQKVVNEVKPKGLTFDVKVRNKRVGKEKGVHEEPEYLGKFVNDKEGLMRNYQKYITRDDDLSEESKIARKNMREYVQQRDAMTGAETKEKGEQLYKEYMKKSREWLE